MLISQALQAAENKPLFSIQPLALIYQHLLPDESMPPEVLLSGQKNSHDYQLSVEDLQKLTRHHEFYWLGREANLKAVSTVLKSDSWLLLDSNQAHAWLAPESLIQLSKQMSVALQKKYPQQTEQILANEARLKQQLKIFFDQQINRFEPLQQQGLLLGHDAFLPFSHALGLKHIELYRSGHSHGHKSDGMADLMHLQQQIKEGNLVCAVEEPDISFVQLQERFPHLHRVALDPMANAFSSLLVFLQSTADNLYVCLQKDKL